MISTLVISVNATATDTLCAVADRQTPGQELEARLDDRSERRLADPAEAQARHRDAQLRRGNVAIRPAHRAADRTRAAVTFRDQLIDARLAHRHDRELCGDEERIGEDQHQQPGQPPEDACERMLHHYSLDAYAFLLEKKCASTN